MFLPNFLGFPSKPSEEHSSGNQNKYFALISDLTTNWEALLMNFKIEPRFEQRGDPLVKHHFLSRHKSHLRSRKSWRLPLARFPHSWALPGLASPTGWVMVLGAGRPMNKHLCLLPLVFNFNFFLAGDYPNFMLSLKKLRTGSSRTAINSYLILKEHLELDLRWL